MGANLKSSLQISNASNNNSSNRRKQRLVSAIPQTAEGRQARHSRGTTVAQSMVYGDPQDRMQFGVPSVRLPLKQQDGA